MKLIVVIALAVTVVVAKPDSTELFRKYDNFDVDEIVDNVRLLKSYLKCYLGEGKCTAEASDIKSLIPEAIQSACGKCSEKQKFTIAKVINATKQKLPAEYERLYNLHDPDKKKVPAFEELLKKYTV